MIEEKYRLITVRDSISGVDTTILIELTKFPDEQSLSFDQIGGVYETIEAFNREWDNSENMVEKTVLCPKCKEPITYYTPKLDEIVNFTCLDILDARRFTNALIELLKDPVFTDDLFDIEETRGA